MKNTRFSNVPTISNWSLMNDFFKDDAFVNGSQAPPATNIEDKEKAFVITMAVPGLNKKDILVSVDKNILTISSEKEESSEEEVKNYTKKEYSFRSFKRSFTLPENVNGDKIEATYSKGELTVNLPKSGKVENKIKQIEIA